MTGQEFRCHKRQFVQASLAVLDERGRSYTLAEAAFPAYSHPNPLISFLFWSRIRKAVQFVEEHARYDRTMDFGCGGGVMLPVLSRYAQSVVAYDLDLSGLRAMEKHIQLPSNVTPTNSIADSADFAKDSFDLIVALDVLEHVEDLEETLRHLAELLRPGGRLLVSGPTENFAYRIGRKLAGQEFSGDYHVHSIYRVRSAMDSCFSVTTIATLFYPVPLFKLYSGELDGDR